MSQAALASMASLHKETISRIERGHLFPSLHTSQRLGTELGLSPDDVARRHGLAARNTV
jgi:DNA-binding XRE family transcriptional regulator